MEPRHQTLLVRCSAIVILIGKLFLGNTWTQVPVNVHTIQPDPAYQNSPPEMLSQMFPFKNGNVTITVPVSRAVYGSTNYEKSSSCLDRPM